MATGGYATQLQGAVFGQTTPVGSAAAVPVALPYTVVDNDQIVTVNNAAVGVINLPQINPAGGFSSVNRRIEIQNLGAGTITVTPFAGDAINAGASYVITTGQGVVVFGNGTTTWLGRTASTPSGTATTLASARLGNVCTVDAVNGINATASRGGLPFLTITAALAAALAGDVVWVLPGTYAEAIVIPASVSVVGLDKQRCILDQTAIGVATDIVTMGVSSGITNMTIQGSALAVAFQLRGILFPNVAGTARVRNCAVSLTHTGGAAASGVEFSGGATSSSDFACLIDNSILVSGSGAQNRFGVYIQSGGSTPVIENCLVRVNRSAGAVAGAYRAAEMSGTGVMTLREGSYEGPADANGADVSQTSGALAIDGANLVTGNANGFSFTATSGGNLTLYGDTGVLPISATRFFRAGTNTVQATEVRLTSQAPRVARAITVTARVAPGAAQSTAVTLLKNGVATTVAATLSGNATTATSSNMSAGFAVGDTYSVREVNSVGSATADIQVAVEWYTG